MRQPPQYRTYYVKPESKLTIVARMLHDAVIIAYRSLTKVQRACILALVLLFLSAVLVMGTPTQVDDPAIVELQMRVLKLETSLRNLAKEHAALLWCSGQSTHNCVDKELLLRAIK